MTALTKQDSNQTQGSICLEISPGTLNGNAADVWNALEPNSWKDFGPTYKLVARTPIKSDRQQLKGVITDMAAAAGFQSDLTYGNTQPFIEGVFCANFRTKNEAQPSSVTAAGTDYVVGSGIGSGYGAGDLLFAKNFTNAANNGLKVVSASTSTTVVAAAGGMVDETGPSGSISRVGFEFASGDATFDDSGNYPALLTTTKDMTAFGLNVGEWVYIGGDATGTKFATAGCNGFARVYSVSAHAIYFDKVQNAVATDAGAGKTLRIFFGRVLKNEKSDLIVQKTYQLERTLGKDDTTATQAQAEYCVNSVLDQFVMTFNTADKITWDLTTVSAGYETRDSATGPKTGTRPVLAGSGAFNTTSNVKRMGLAVTGPDEAQLYAFVMDASITIKNNTALNKAIGVLGGFSASLGNFSVSATMDAYFANVAAQAVIRDNDSCTFDAIMCRDNAGIAIDIPLMTLGGGLLKVAANAPITLALSNDAASAVDVNAASDYTAMMCFFDYLPTAAM